ncbi:threalose-6-phosphate phosphatase [Puttea exsequens]|nr:threalose-6-phosphate phosphatase [Puttea exsequens]
MDQEREEHGIIKHCRSLPADCFHQHPVSAEGADQNTIAKTIVSLKQEAEPKFSIKDEPSEHLQDADEPKVGIKDEPVNDTFQRVAGASGSETVPSDARVSDSHRRPIFKAESPDSAKASTKQEDMLESSSPEIATPDTSPDPQDEVKPDVAFHKARALLEAEMLKTYGPATRRLLLLDYDGTLTPIVSDPAAAVLAPTVREVLGSLAREPKNTLWIISGRDQKFLGEQFDDFASIGLVAEHGAFIRRPGEVTWKDLTKSTSMEWKLISLQTYETACNAIALSRVEEKKAAVVWHYRDSDQETANLMAKKMKRKLGKALAKYPVEVTEGKCVIEARLDFLNKGSIVREILREFDSDRKQQPDFVLSIGDDVTDEGRP